jgi:hypothetical protein
LSLTLREERRSREFENRMPGGIFGPKRGEVNLKGRDSLGDLGINGRIKWVLKK